MLSVLSALFQRISYLVDIIGQFRQKNDIGSSGNSGMKGKPSGFMSHHFHNKDPAVGSCRRMDAVNGMCCDIQGTVKTKRHVSSPNIIIDGFGKGNHVEAFLL